MSCPVLWLTGLPGSGKSAISERLKEAIDGAVILRVDEIRGFLTPNPTYSNEERELVYRALVYTAMKLSQLHHTVIIDATGNLRRWREFAAANIPNFLEVYIRCPLEVCMQRESSRQDRYGAPLNIYQKAREGWPVPGVNVPYEEPIAPALTIDSDSTTIDEAVSKIKSLIQGK